MKADGYIVLTTKGEHWFPLARTAAQAKRIALNEALIPKDAIISIRPKAGK